MAHCDMALHAERACARRDLLDLEGAQRAHVMQMDVDIDAMLPGDAEHDVEMLFDVPVETRGIETADEVGAEPDGLVQQLRRARARQDATLGKGDELDVDQAFVFLAHAQDRLERFQPDRAVHHDMAAHLRAAVGDAEIELIARSHIHRRSLGHVLGLEGDALMHVEPVGARLVRPPGVAIEAGVDELRREI